MAQYIDSEPSPFVSAARPRRTDKQTKTPTQNVWATKECHVWYLNPTKIGPGENHQIEFETVQARATNLTRIRTREAQTSQMATFDEFLAIFFNPVLNYCD